MNGSHALIVGGTKGIGCAVARAFLAEGCRVTVVGRSGPPSELRHERLDFFKADLARPGQRRRLIAHMRRNGKGLAHLVFLQRYRGDAAGAWKGEIDTSLSATKEIIEGLADAFGTAPERSIVMVGSIASLLVAEEQPVGYHVAKAALAQMARYYAVALGPRGIRVNCVSPGIVLKDEARKFYSGQRKLLSLYRRVIPLGRMIDADEIAQVVTFLCSRKAAAITGQNIVADGGVSLQWQESLVRRTSLKNVAITRNAGRS